MLELMIISYFYCSDLAFSFILLMMSFEYETTLNQINYILYIYDSKYNKYYETLKWNNDSEWNYKLFYNIQTYSNDVPLTRQSIMFLAPWLQHKYCVLHFYSHQLYTSFSIKWTVFFLLLFLYRSNLCTYP